MIRFHLDENVDHAIAHGLRQRGIDVTTSTDAGLISVDDVDQLEFARRENRVLVTHDTDFLNPSVSTQPHPGIVFSPKDERTIGDIIRHLALLAAVLDEGEMENRIEYF